MESFKVHQKFFVLIVVLQFFVSMKEVEAKEVECEYISDKHWGLSDGSLKTCFMDETTSIDELGATISPTNELVEGLEFSFNKKIFYLPDNVAGTFPNLEFYATSSCSVKNITKRNFDGLVKLKFLFLSHNQIEKIATDTFKSLTALENLGLFGNKIKFMNGEAFKGLSKLTTVNLGGNICIDEKFNYPTKIATLQKQVSEECGFDKQEKTTTTAKTTTGTTLTIERLKAQKQKKCSNHAAAALQKCQSDLNVQEILSSKTKEEIQQLKSTIFELKAEKVELKSEVSDLKFELTALKNECRSNLVAEKLQCKQQLDFSRELHNKLESQWNATCIAETRELQQKETEITD